MTRSELERDRERERERDRERDREREWERERERDRDVTGDEGSGRGSRDRGEGSRRGSRELDWDREGDGGVPLGQPGRASSRDTGPHSSSPSDRKRDSPRISAEALPRPASRDSLNHPFSPRQGAGGGGEWGAPGARRPPPRGAHQVCVRREEALGGLAGLPKHEGAHRGYPPRSQRLWQGRLHQQQYCSVVRALAQTVARSSSSGPWRRGKGTAAARQGETPGPPSPGAP